jgi:hypothetical protein
MAGEMSQSEVTRESYPGLFALRDALKRRGIDSEPRAFDQYQGPYLSVPGIGKVWYSDEPTFYVGAGPVSSWSNDKDSVGRKLRRIDYFIIEAFGWAFETIGAHHVKPESDTSVAAGVYTLRQAAKRISELTHCSVCGAAGVELRDDKCGVCRRRGK